MVVDQVMWECYTYSFLVVASENDNPKDHFQLLKNTFLVINSGSGLLDMNFWLLEHLVPFDAAIRLAEKYLGPLQNLSSVVYYFDLGGEKSHMGDILRIKTLPSDNNQV